MIKDPLVSVVILNWNRKKDTATLVASLAHQTFQNFEVIVVDNASSDGSVFYLRRRFKELTVVESEVNVGLAGFNLGMAAARGAYFVLLACDTVVPDALLEKQVEKLERNPGLGISAASTYLLGTKTYLGPNRARVGNNERGYRVTYFDGNGVGLRREVFERVGGYSKKYFICLEELEWAVRILSAGFEIACFTDVVIYHKKTKAGGNYRSRMGYYYARNWIWFYARYLPWSVMRHFLWLHLNSVRRETGRWGKMRFLDCVEGVIVGLVYLPWLLRRRRRLPGFILERVKLDLFPNPYHLYIYS